MLRKNDRENKISPLKIILFISIICVLIFAIINVAWFILMKGPYNRFIKQCAENGEYMAAGSGYRYVTQDGKYDFGVYSFPYLNFKGVSMAVGNNGEIRGHMDEKTGEMLTVGKINSFVVHFYMYRYYFALRIDDAEENCHGAVAVDKELNIINKDNYKNEYIDEMEQYIKKHYDELQAMADFGIEMWDIK